MDSRRCQQVHSLAVDAGRHGVVPGAGQGWARAEPADARGTRRRRPRRDAGRGTALAEPRRQFALAGSGGPVEEIGPFTILNVGNRLSSADVFNAAHLQQTNANIIGIRVSLTDKRWDDRTAKKLVERLFETNFASVAVILHSPRIAANKPFQGTAGWTK